MLGTGGTIACKHTEGGLTPAITPEELVGFIPDVKDVCEVYTHQVCNVDRHQCNPAHWKMMSRAVEDHYKDYDGFVICHGSGYAGLHCWRSCRT